MEKQFGVRNDASPFGGCSFIGNLSCSSCKSCLKVWLMLLLPRALLQFKTIYEVGYFGGSAWFGH